jgi:hypothetical protein
MSLIRQVFIVGLFALLSVGPVVAAPVTRSALPTVSAPASSTPLRSALETLAALVGAAAVGITISKDTGTLAKKFVTRATAAAPDYKAGVTGKGGEWEARTRESEQNYVAGVNDAISRGAFGKNVAGSGGKYEANAATLGAQRFGPGVQNAEGAWARGVQPALDVLKSLTLPPKGPKRSPQNQQRSNAVQLALGAMKTRS